MDKPQLPIELVELLQSVSNRRARIVIDHILEHGFITTEELKQYGYDHPPRAARDVREAGIPLETFNVKSSTGRRIAAYRFGDLSQLQRERLSGREVFPRGFKNQLYLEQQGKCAVCGKRYEERYLQVDHRVPYEVSGEPNKLTRNIKDYMLLCGSDNRAKSWSCEHCPNWLDAKSAEICLRCYWGNPVNYTHVALQDIRRLDITWDSKEVRVYDRLKKIAQKEKTSLPEFVKRLLAMALRRKQ